MKKKKKTQKVNSKNGKQNILRKLKRPNTQNEKRDKKSAPKEELKKKEKERSKNILEKKKKNVIKKKKKRMKQKKPKGTSESLGKNADLLENSRKNAKNDVLSSLIENEANIRELVKMLFIIFLNYSLNFGSEKQYFYFLFIFYSTGNHKKLRKTFPIFYSAWYP